MARKINRVKLGLPGGFRFERALLFGFGAFLITVLAAYSALAFDTLGSAPERVTLIALGLLYCALGTVWFCRCELTGAHQATPETLAYLATQCALATVIITLGLRMGADSIWLVPIPLISHGFVLLPRRPAWALAGAVFLIFMAVLARLHGADNALRALPGFISAVFFVALFSNIATDQIKARVQVEQLAAELREANQRLASYAAQAGELATVRERNRLAREVHDSLGHYLTVVNVQLEAARSLIASDPAKAGAAITKAQTLTRDGLGEVRRSVAALRAGPLDNRALQDAIDTLVDEARTAGLTVDYAVTGLPRALPPQCELTLFRAAQEGLTNIRKHANATRAQLSLDFEDARTRLRITDNGRPAGGEKIAETASDANGFGLIGLRERAQLLGGTVSAAPGPDGFVLEVAIPNE